MNSSIRRHVQMILAIIFICSGSGYAQQFNSSVYSAYGIGDISPNGFGLNAILGGGGVALCDSMNLNNVNPAAYAGIYSRVTQVTTFSADLTYGRWADEANTFQNSNLSFLGLAMWFRLHKKAGLTVGLAPYSKVDYNITTTNSFDGLSSVYTVNYLGTGGLSRFYIGGAYSPIKNLSVGANLSYYFGSVNHNQYIDAESSLGLTYTIENIAYMHTFQFDYGLQYAIDAGKSDFVLGLTYSMEKGLSGRQEYQVLSETDTLEHTESDLKGMFLPQSIGAGITWKYKNRYMVMADYSQENWQYLNTENEFSAQNSYKYSFGFEVLPNLGSLKAIKRVGFGIGGYYRISYLNLKGQSIDDYGATAGITIPTRGKSVINIAYQRSFRAYETSKLIKEDYHGLTVNISMFDFWFSRRKFE